MLTLWCEEEARLSRAFGCDWRSVEYDWSDHSELTRHLAALPWYFRCAEGAAPQVQEAQYWHRGLLRCPPPYWDGLAALFTRTEGDTLDTREVEAGDGELAARSCPRAEGAAAAAILSSSRSADPRLPPAALAHFSLATDSDDDSTASGVKEEMTFRIMNLEAQLSEQKNQHQLQMREVLRRLKEFESRDHGVEACAKHSAAPGCASDETNGDAKHGVEVDGNADGGAKHSEEYLRLALNKALQERDEARAKLAAYERGEHRGRLEGARRLAVPMVLSTSPRPASGPPQLRASPASDASERVPPLSGGRSGLCGQRHQAIQAQQQWAPLLQAPGLPPPGLTAYSRPRSPPLATCGFNVGVMQVASGLAVNLADFYNHAGTDARRPVGTYSDGVAFSAQPTCVPCMSYARVRSGTRTPNGFGD